jgi:hypothetical protein
MAPTLPAGILVPDQVKIRFVHKHGRLESLARNQPRRQRRGQLSELCIHDPVASILFLFVHFTAPSKKISPPLALRRSLFQIDL